MWVLLVLPSTSRPVGSTSLAKSQRLEGTSSFRPFPSHLKRIPPDLDVQAPDHPNRNLGFRNRCNDTTSTTTYNTPVKRTPFHVLFRDVASSVFRRSLRLEFSEQTGFFRPRKCLGVAFAVVRWVYLRRLR